jgi:hypothetical protein
VLLLVNYQKSTSNQEILLEAFLTILMITMNFTSKVQMVHQLAVSTLLLLFRAMGFIFANMYPKLLGLILFPLLCSEYQ